MKTRFNVNASFMILRYPHFGFFLSTFSRENWLKSLIRDAFVLYGLRVWDLDSTHPEIVSLCTINKSVKWKWKHSYCFCVNWKYRLYLLRYGFITRSTQILRPCYWIYSSNTISPAAAKRDYNCFARRYCVYISLVLVKSEKCSSHRCYQNLITICSTLPTSSQ